MSKYDVKAVVCDYGIFDNDELKIIVNSQANALLIKYILEQELQHKVVIADLLEKKNKKKRKLRAMTNAEYCKRWRLKHHGRCYSDYDLCPLFSYLDCCNSQKPFRLANGKYIFKEVEE